VSLLVGLISAASASTAWVPPHALRPRFRHFRWPDPAMHAMNARMGFGLRGHGELVLQTAHARSPCAIANRPRMRGMHHIQGLRTTVGQLQAQGGDYGVIDEDKLRVDVSFAEGATEDEALLATVLQDALAMLNSVG